MYQELSTIRTKSVTDKVLETPSNVLTAIAKLHCIKTHKKAVKEGIITLGNSSFFKNVIFASVVQMNASTITDATCELVTNFNVSQNLYQKVIKNSIGKPLYKVFGDPIFPAREPVFNRIKEFTGRTETEVGLHCTYENIHGNKGAIVNKKALTWFIPKIKFQDKICSV